MKHYASEAEFLADYDIHQFNVPLTTVDLCIFSLLNEELKVLILKRANFPFKDRWALPGGFVDVESDVDLHATALRKLLEKTSVKAPYVEQLETIGNSERDPRGWSMTVVYFALIPHTAVAAHTEDVDEVEWLSVNAIKSYKLAFDHEILLKKAVQRLRNKVGYSTLPIHIMPKEFTLAELQRAYEIIMDREVDKKAFRRRLESAQLLVETGKSQQLGGRPAKLYRAKKGLYYYSRSI